MASGITQLRLRNHNIVILSLGTAQLNSLLQDTTECTISCEIYMNFLFKISNSIVRQAQGFASRWCVSIEIWRFCQCCYSSPVPGLAPFIVPTGIMNSDSKTYSQQEVKSYRAFWNAVYSTCYPKVHLFQESI